jgi:hypothetical protein
MFTDEEHKFTVQEHMFTDGKHKFTVHKHKKIRGNLKKQRKQKEFVFFVFLDVE